MEDKMLMMYAAGGVISLIASYLVSQLGSDFKTKLRIQLVSFLVLGGVLSFASYLMNTFDPDTDFEYTDELYEYDMYIAKVVMSCVVLVAVLIAIASKPEEEKLDPLEVDVTLSPKNAEDWLHYLFSSPFSNNASKAAKAKSSDGDASKRTGWNGADCNGCQFDDSVFNELSPDVLTTDPSKMTTKEIENSLKVMREVVNNNVVTGKKDE